MSQPKERKKIGQLSTENEIYGRVPPQVTELEAAVLGAILLVKDAWDTASEIIKPECFYLPAHKAIFRACRNLTKKHQPIDSLTVMQELKSTGELELVGGPFGLSKITDHVVSSANILTHCRIILQKYLQREIIRVCGESIAMAYDERADGLAILDQVEKNILEIGNEHIQGGMISMDSALMKAVDKIEEYRTLDSNVTGIPTGFENLDRATRGWQPGDLIVIAARPSVGKTALMLNLARHAALNSVRPTAVGVWSLEMKIVPLMLRMLSAESEVILHKIQTGRVDDATMQRIYEKGVAPLSKAKIFFNDAPGITAARIASQARRYKKKHGLGMIVVDYMQLIKGDGRSRDEEIGNVALELKSLGLELEVPVIAISSMSREIEKRTGNKTPQMSDLRESGAIEFHADVIIFLWGPSEDEVKQNGDLAGRRYARIAKQRNGILMTMDLQFKNEIQLFEQFEKSMAIAELPRDGKWRPANLPYLDSE